MEPAAAIAIALFLLVGLSLGALGGGGSVLTVPILVYVAGVSARDAVPLSMVVVGGTSVAAAVLHYRQGNFHPAAAAYFASTGVVASFFAAKLTHLVSQRMLLLIFAMLMLAAGFAMRRGRPEGDTGARCDPVRCLAAGAGVGGLTGFLGVGGGFLIVPALVLLAGVGTKAAVGSSLAIIAMNAVAGLLGHLRQTAVDPALAGSFLATALLGTFAGIAVADRVPAASLRRAFGWFIVALGLVIGGLSGFGVGLP